MDHTMDHLKLSKVDQLVADCVSSNEENKSTRIGLFEEMIKTGVIFVDDALPIVIKEIKTVSDLGLIVICLRNGAYRNLYVHTQGLGMAHIIIFAFSIHFRPNKRLFEYIYNLLILSGASSSLPSYNSSGNNISNHGDRKGNSLVQSESVFEWLIHKGKGEFKCKSVSSEILDHIKSRDYPKLDREIYSVYLDDTSICDWDPEMLPYLLYSRNSEWRKLRVIKKDSLYLKVAVNATFLDLVINMLDDGLRPSYVDFSFWIAHYKHIYSFNNVDYLVDQCESMFLELIKRGYQIDLYYLNEIGSINPQFRIKIMDEYSRPLLNKVCNYRSDGYIPDEMKEAAIYFGIPEGTSKENFCNAVEHITSADLDAIIAGNREKNSHAIGSRLNFLTDYVNTRSSGSCDNLVDFNDNPLDYPNDLLAYYKDNNGKTWCFLSKDFESLIHSEINPSTKGRLPIEFINRLKHQTDQLNFFGIPLSEPKTVSFLINKIKKSDTPSNEKTDEIVKRVMNVLKYRGITEAVILNKMKIGEIISKFQRLGINMRQILLVGDSELDKTINAANTEFSPRIIFNLICISLSSKFDSDIATVEQFCR